MIREKILNSIQPVVEGSRFVKINEIAAKRLAGKIKDAKLVAWDNEHQYLGRLPQTVQYYFFLDSINFCFWAKKGEEKWHFQKDGQWLSGYYAFAYAIKKAFEADSKLLNAEHLTKISSEEFAKIFKGRGGLPLLQRRHEIIKEIFQVLEKKFDGQAMNLIKTANYETDALINLLFSEFPSFRDVGAYHGQEVYFLKRAQVFASDITQTKQVNPVTTGLRLWHWGISLRVFFWTIHPRVYTRGLLVTG